MNKMQDFSTTKLTENTEIEEDPITKKVIGDAIEVHRALGPGLLESAYEICLLHELQLKQFKVERQKPQPIFYKDVMLDCGYRLIKQHFFCNLRFFFSQTLSFLFFNAPATPAPSYG